MEPRELMWSPKELKCPNQKSMESGGPTSFCVWDGKMVPSEHPKAASHLWRDVHV